MSKHTIISDPDRRPMLVTRRSDGGGFHLQAGRNYIVLSRTELARLVAFAHVEMVPVTPAKYMQRWAKPVESSLTAASASLGA